MTWFMLFCAWGIKSGGCITPVQMPSKRACEFALKQQTLVARQKEREWAEGMVVNGRCIGVRP